MIYYKIYSHRLLYIDITQKRKGLKQKNEKKYRKYLRCYWCFMMVFTTAGMNVAAAGEMDSVAGEADIQSQEQPQTLDETDTQQEATQQTSEGILEYVYVDESVVNMPQTQNIAVGFSDENLVLESAVLHYSSVVTGEQFEMPASATVNNTVLFTQDIRKDQKKMCISWIA